MVSKIDQIDQHQTQRVVKALKDDAKIAESEEICGLHLLKIALKTNQYGRANWGRFMLVLGQLSRIGPVSALTQCQLQEDAGLSGGR